MITIENQRYERDGRPCGNLITQRRDVPEALRQLVVFEFGYGGTIADISEDSITMHTPCVGRYDIVQFRGAKKDFLPLLLFVKAITDAGKVLTPERILTDALKPDEDKTYDVRRSPMFLEMAVPILVGGGTVKGTLIACVAGNEVTNAEEAKAAFERCKVLSTEELTYLFYLRCEDPKLKMDDLLALR